MRTVLDRLVWVALKEKIEHDVTLHRRITVPYTPEKHLREILKEANLPIGKVNYWGLVLKGEAYQKVLY